MEKTIQTSWGFFIAPNSIFDADDLNSYEKICYMYLCRCADSEKKSFPSYEKIASKTGVSRRTAMRSIKSLEEKGYVVVQRRKLNRKKNTSNLYTIIPPEHVSGVTQSPEQIIDSDSQTPPISDSQTPSLVTESHPNYTHLNNTHIINTQQQQQESEKRVVVVQDKYKSLFQKPLDKKQAESLIDLAEKHNVCVLDRIENTYTYHTQVKACRNIIGAIKYAIENEGGWDISTPVKPSSKIAKAIDVPKSYYRVTKTRTAEEEAELAIKQVQLKAKIKAMYADDATESSQI